MTNTFIEKKLDEIVLLSKECGYPEMDREFWLEQPAGVIILILSMAELLDEESK